MSFKKTLLLALILIIMGGYFYIYEFKGEEKKRLKEEKALSLFLFSKQDLEEIKLIRKKEEILLKKKDTQWNMESPVSCRADSKETDDIIEVLQNAKRERTIEKSPKNLSPFGLKEPDIKLFIKLKNASESRGILLGKSNPTNQFIYAKMADRPDVFLTDISLQKALDKKSYDLRDKSLVDMELKEIKRVDFIPKDSVPITIEKGDQKKWVVNWPIKAKGDSKAIENLLVKLKNSNIKKFIDNPGNLSDYGLTKPDFEIVFGSEDKDKTEILLIGKMDKEKNLFSKRKGIKTVFIIDGGLIDRLPRSANDLRDRTLLAFNREDVSQIELRGREKPILLKREDDSWRITRPIEARADELQIQNILWTLENSRANGFAEDKPKSLNAFGLDKPAKELKIWLKGKKEPKALLFGNTTPDKEVYAKLRDGETVFLLESAIMDDLFRVLFDLRDRRLVTFKNNDLDKIFIAFEKKELSLQKKKNEWELRAFDNKKKKIKEFNIKEIVWTLNELRFQDIYENKDMPKNIELKIALFKKGDKELDTLIFYKTDLKDDFSLARVASRKTVYRIKRESLNQLKDSIRRALEPEK